MAKLLGKDMKDLDEWFGPVFMCSDCKTLFMCSEDPAFCPKCGEKFNNVEPT
jgi:rubrerythrin